jgi:hypothetical protein
MHNLNKTSRISDAVYLIEQFTFSKSVPENITKLKLLNLRFYNYHNMKWICAYFFVKKPIL